MKKPPPSWPTLNDIPQPWNTIYRTGEFILIGLGIGLVIVGLSKVFG